jgi:DNA-binding MarR family transcriptional regulator
MPDNLRDIPLNEIVQDWRVKDYVRRRVNELTLKNIAKFKNHQSQVLSCHSWLLCLHYESINRLQGKYGISKPEFMVLMGAYLFSRVGRGQFRAKELSETLLSWQHNKVYRHLKKLSQKGYVTIYKNRYSGLQQYSLTIDGKRVIRAFNQHYWQVFGEVWEEIGDFPTSFDSGSLF